MQRHAPLCQGLLSCWLVLAVVDFVLSVFDQAPLVLAVVDLVLAVFDQVPLVLAAETAVYLVLAYLIKLPFDAVIAW